MLTLAVERILSAEKLGEKFEYPKTYSPEKYTDGTFGIMGGPPTEVESGGGSVGRSTCKGARRSG
jgi:hypothetical protein